MSFTYHFQVDATLVSNEFIDRYLAEANGEYVKVQRPARRSPTISASPLPSWTVTSFPFCRKKAQKKAPSIRRPRARA